MKNSQRELINDVVTGLMVAATFAAIVPGEAFAQLNSSVTAAGQQVFNPAIKLVDYIAYALGTVMVVAGIAGVKKHSDQPSSNPLGPGIGKLGAGAAFLAAPTVIAVLTSSPHSLSGNPSSTTCPAFSKAIRLCPSSPLPLVSGAPWRRGRGFRPPTKTDAADILKRDDFACRFCDFRATQFQRIVPADQGYVTACSFRRVSIGPERAGPDGRWGSDLAAGNHPRSIEPYRARYLRCPCRRRPRDRYRESRARRFDDTPRRAKKRLGSDDPLLLATVLHENLTEAERDAATQKLDGVD